MENQMESKKRIIFWDNIKGVLIFLVVLGHFFYQFCENVTISYLAYFIYLFHMPAFVFISGYFSGNEIRLKRLKKYGIFYAIGNTVMMWFAWGYYGEPINLLKPSYSYWYFIALIAWNIMIIKLRNIKGILPISIVIALLIGNFVEVDNTLAISRIICFFPFFILGNKVENKNWKKENVHFMHKIIAGFVFIAVILGSYILVPKLDFNQLLMYPYSSQQNILNRIGIFVIAFLMIYFFYILIPKKEILFFKKFGENSLYIFFYHRIFTILLADLWIWSGNTIATVLMSFVLAFIVCAAFGNDKIKDLTEKAYQKILEFTQQTRNIHAKTILKFSIILVILTTLLLPYYNALKENKNKNNETFSQQETEKIYPILTNEEKEKINNSFSILFAGDLILLQEQVKRGYQVENNLYNFDDIFEYTKKYIQTADCSIGVFEGPMAGEEAGYSNSDFDDGIKLYLNFPDSFGNAVKNAGFDLVTVANNHIFDKNEDGARRTIQKLDELEMDYTGFSEKENRAKIIEKDGLKLGILSYTYGFNYWDEEEKVNQNLVPILVDENNEYFEKIKKDVLQDFENLKAQNPDIIVVLPHYGTQFSHEIDAYQKTWNTIFLEAGADIILGDHAHSVQPVEIKKNADGEDALVVNCPGNFVNSYREFDGDATAMVEVYLDKATGNLVGSSVIPMWVQATKASNYRALPIDDIVHNENLKNQISTVDEKRAREVFELITNVMLGARLTIDQVQEKLYFMPDGYKREAAWPIPIDKNSEIVKKIMEANSICVIGDSITEGTKNGGYGWFEPLLNGFPDKKIINISKGGATTKTILQQYQENPQTADLYIIAIGTNDVRYREPSICSMDAQEYVENIQKMIAAISNQNEANFVFIAPWNSLENDENTDLLPAEKQNLLDVYAQKLEEFCRNHKYVYSNPNPIIFELLKKEPAAKYMIDYIHPNSSEGIRLYSRAVQETSLQK